MYDVHHIGVYIARAPDEVYEYVFDPRNLPQWAEGLARSEVTKDGDTWVADAPFGKAKIQFAERNSFGVLDHDVELESGVVMHNLVRVMPSADGSEFLFSLFRQPGMSDQQFAADRSAVEKDLHRLKSLLET